MISRQDINVLILLFFGLFTQCEKYQDDKVISLTSAEKRLIRNWKLVNYKVNGLEGISRFYSSNQAHIKDSLPRLYIVKTAQEYNFSTGGVCDDGNGSWKWINSKKQIQFSIRNYNHAVGYGGPPASRSRLMFPTRSTTFVIKQLDKETFKIITTVNDTMYELIYQ